MSLEADPNADRRDASSVARLRVAIEPLLAAGHVDHALIELQQSLSVRPDDAGVLDLAAAVLCGAGQFAQALVCALRAVELQPNEPSFQYTLGRIHKAAQQPQAAIAAYRQALRLQPDHLDAALSLGIALRGCGSPGEAVAVYRDVLTRHPESLIGWINLANALADAGQTQEAQDTRLKAHALAQSAAEQALAQARSCEDAGDREAALAACQQAAAVAPGWLPAQLAVAKTLMQLQKVDEAVLAFQQVLQADPSHLESLYFLGGLHEYRGQVEASTACYERLLQLAPNDPTRFCLALLLPTILPHGTDIAALRRDHEQRLIALAATSPVLSEPLKDLQNSVSNNYFRLAYHGAGNRELHALHARLFLQACPSLAWVAPHCQQPVAAPAGRRLRVGLISQFFRHHSIGRTSVGLVEQLSREHFEVTVLFVPPRRDDAMAQRIRAAADAVVDLPPDLTQARQAISELELDILFYQDIGMEPFTYLLAFARLAPVQCVSYGHPDTTGIPNMDVWISSTGFEPPDAQEHYTEQLMLIDGVGTLAYYDRPQPSPEAVLTREMLGLPANAPLIACPQTLFKFHPEMDDLLAAIFARVPHARLLLATGDNPASVEQLMARWKARGDGIDKVAVFVPPLDRDHFLLMLKLSDVILDTIHFNGMNSSLEGFAMGTPIVTLPKAFQRGRHTQAMYRRMGYTELIAADEADYVRLVVRLATDAAFRARASRNILERCGVLFAEQAVVRGFEDVLRTAFAQRAITPDVLSS